MTDAATVMEQAHAFLVALWAAMDRRDDETVLSMLTVDARWERERWREGQDDIRDALRRRPPLAASRHCIVNLQVARDAAALSCRYGLIIFGQPRSDPPAEPPYRTTGPRMGDWTTRLVRGGDSWLAGEITGRLVFDRL